MNASFAPDCFERPPYRDFHARFLSALAGLPSWPSPEQYDELAAQVPRAMDVQLPRMSGLDATRVLRADERTRHIPIIIITSFALSGDRERATAAGAAGYLAKPYSPRELLGLVHEFLPEAS